MYAVKKHLVIWMLIPVFSVTAVAQQKQLDSTEFVYSGQYKPSVADVNKMNASPVVIDSTPKIPVTPYSIRSKKINTEFGVEPIVPAQMVGEPLTKLYNSLVKIGMGNYTTPYGELWVNTLRSKDYAAGFRAKHFSSAYTPKGYGYGGFNDDELSVYGKKFLKKHSLIGNADYARNTVHLYGYDTDSFSLDRNNTELRYNLIKANAQLKSHFSDPKEINHDINLGYYTLMDRYDTYENNVKITGEAQTAIEKNTLKVNALVDYYNYKTTIDTVNNTILSFQPSYVAADTNYNAQIGFTVSADVYTNITKYYIYPNLFFSYNIFEHIIIPYAGISGGLQKNSYKSFTDVNPFVLSHLTMMNSNKTIEFYGGLKGTLSATTSYHLRVSQQSLNNMAMFVNDTNGFQNQFAVIYDDAKILSVHAEAGYQLREKIRVNLAGDYYDYKMKNELRAWYKPQVQVTLSGNYNIKDKIVAKLDLFYIANQFAKTYEADTTAANGLKVVGKELKGLLDINIGGEYRYNKKLSFFVTFNNIANFRYYRWSNYPTQKFNFMAGISYSF
jgi:hypothetical protein